MHPHTPGVSLKLLGPGFKVQLAMWESSDNRCAIHWFLKASVLKVINLST